MEIENLTKVFRADRLLALFGKSERVIALDSINMSVGQGRIVGVVGSNGSGKTTLMRILTHLLEPDTGRVSIAGLCLFSSGFEIRRLIGYASSDERSFFWRLSGRENLEFFAKLYGLNSSRARERTAELINEFGFGPNAGKLFRDYSAGMRKKISVMRAMIHKPAFLLLDEITNSLDPDSANMVKEMVREYISFDQNRAALWSTHRLEEISQVCDDYIALSSGKIVSSGRIADFTDSTDNRKLNPLYCGQ